MLRITPESLPEGVERFRLEGRLAGSDVVELGRVMAPPLGRPGRLAIELSGLTYVDTEGARLLRELVARNVEIHGGSSFVTHLLGLS